MGDGCNLTLGKKLRKCIKITEQRIVLYSELLAHYAISVFSYIYILQDLFPPGEWDMKLICFPCLPNCFVGIVGWGKKKPF